MKWVPNRHKLSPHEDGTYRIRPTYLFRIYLQYYTYIIRLLTFSIKSLKHFSLDNEHKYDKICAHLVIADVLVCTFTERNTKKKKMPP